MGYHASGDVTFVFADTAARDAAVAALAADDPTPSPGWGLIEYAADAGFEITANNDDETEYFGYIAEKWLSRTDQFGALVAPFCSDLHGEFRGEDDHIWFWFKDPATGGLGEDSGGTVRDDDLGYLKDAEAALMHLLDVAAVPGVTAERVAREVWVTLAVRTGNPDVLTRLGQHPDPEVRDAVTRRIVATVAPQEHTDG